MHAASERKLIGLLRTLAILDIALYFFLSGSNWVVPIINVDLTAVQSIDVILVLLSYLTFMLCCMAVVDKQSYDSIVDQFRIRISRETGIDPDFFNASQKYFQFSLKMYRTKMNVWGMDFFEPYFLFRLFSKVLYIIMAVSVLLFPAAHLGLIFVVLSNIISSDIADVTKALVTSLSVLLNTAAILFVIGMIIPSWFKDTIAESVQTGQDADADATETKQ